MCNQEREINREKCMSLETKLIDHHQLKNDEFLEAIKKLTRSDIAKTIEKLSFEKLGAKISVCIPKIESEKYKIHFLTGGTNKNIFFCIAELTVEIQELLEFEDIIVTPLDLFKHEVINELLEKITPLSESEKLNSFVNICLSL